MLSTNQNRYVILSIDDEADETSRTLFEAILTREGIGFNALQGSYKGQVEHSYLVSFDDWQAFPLFSLYTAKQESVLILGAADKYNRKDATLHYLATGDEITLGKLGSVSKHEALASEGWSYLPSLDKYFITKDNWTN